MSENMTYPVPKMLVAIVERDQAKKVSELLQQAHVHLHYQFYAQGTASSEMMDLLGLGNTDKIVVLCVAPEPIIKSLLDRIAQDIRLIKKGKGIAFTLPLSGAANPIILLLKEEIQESLINHIESEVKKVKSEATHDLILAVINQGYSEELMESAKAVGATGGTVIHARRIGSEESVKFLGISMQAEKEIVAILVRHEQKGEIMKTINHDCGMNTEAQGMVLSLPVDSVVGMPDC